MKRQVLFGGLALAMAFGMGLGMTACSPAQKIDYKTATYAEMKEVDWDAKTVQYQFLNDTIDGYGASWPECMNLYTDGSVAVWQSTVTGFHVTHWAVESKYVIWDFYGYWEETDGKIDINLKGEGYSVTSDFGTTVSPTELSYKEVSLTNGKGDVLGFVLMSSVGRDIGEMTSNKVSCDGTVHYNNLNAFFNSYKDSYVAE